MPIEDADQNDKARRDARLSPDRTDAGDRYRSPTPETLDVAWVLPTAEPSIRPEESWSRYRIEAILGEGGMGRVYLAYDLQLRGASNRKRRGANRRAKSGAHRD